MIPKRGLKHFTETGAVFEDGSEVHDTDLVLNCSGFGSNLDIVDLPGFKGLNMLSVVINAFIPDNLSNYISILLVLGQRRRENFDLYLWEFLPDSPHQSLAFINFGSWYQVMSYFLFI